MTKKYFFNIWKNKTPKPYNIIHNGVGININKIRRNIHDMYKNTLIKPFYYHEYVSMNLNKFIRIYVNEVRIIYLHYNAMYNYNVNYNLKKFISKLFLEIISVETEREDIETRFLCRYDILYNKLYKNNCERYD